jgi:hypothetical protein
MSVTGGECYGDFKESEKYKLMAKASKRLNNSYLKPNEKEFNTFLKVLKPLKKRKNPLTIICSKMKCNTLRWLVTKLPSESVAYGILHTSYP